MPRAPTWVPATATSWERPPRRASTEAEDEAARRREAVFIVDEGEGGMGEIIIESDFLTSPSRDTVRWPVVSALPQQQQLR